MYRSDRIPKRCNPLETGIVHGNLMGYEYLQLTLIQTIHQLPSRLVELPELCRPVERSLHQRRLQNYNRDQDALYRPRQP